MMTAIDNVCHGKLTQVAGGRRTAADGVAGEGWFDMEIFELRPKWQEEGIQPYDDLGIPGKQEEGLKAGQFTARNRKEVWSA